MNEVHKSGDRKLEYGIIRRIEIERFKEINRSEKVEEVYYLRKGRLELDKESYDIKGWHPQELEEYIIRLYELYDRGGYIFGAFDGDKVVGMGSLERKSLAKDNATLKLDMLYISAEYRGQGVGRKLMELCKAKAKELGAAKLYISATPFRNTVDFYMSVGAEPTAEPDPVLFALEPLDIHLELAL